MRTVPEVRRDGQVGSPGRAAAHTTGAGAVLGGVLSVDDVVAAAIVGAPPLAGEALLQIVDIARLWAGAVGEKAAVLAGDDPLLADAGPAQDHPPALRADDARRLIRQLRAAPGP